MLQYGYNKWFLLSKLKKVLQRYTIIYDKKKSFLTDSIPHCAMCTMTLIANGSEMWKISKIFSWDTRKKDNLGLRVSGSCKKREITTF